MPIKKRGRRSTKLSFKRPPTLAIIGVILALIVILPLLEVLNVTNWIGGSGGPASNKSVIKASTPSTNSPVAPQPTSTTSNSPTTPTNPASGTSSASTKDATSSDTTASSDGTLIAPSGSFVSNHIPNISGTPNPNQEQSVCVTTPGASCHIEFTNGNVTRSLPTVKTDNNGAAYWTWYVTKEAGFSEGNWDITAVANLNGQTKSAKDSLQLKVQP